MIVTGKGMFIWDARMCEGGMIKRILAKADRAGLTHMPLKMLDGVHVHNANYTPILRRQKARELPVIGWGYVYGRDPIAEASAAVGLIQKTGLTHWVIDAELEFKGRKDNAERYCRALIEGLNEIGLGSTKIGLSSYYLPQLHPTFPWKMFQTFCDFVMPQVYWYTRNSVQALRSSVSQHQLLGFKEIIPTGPVYWEGMGVGGSAAPRSSALSKFDKFMAEIKQQPVQAVNFWSWQHCPSEVWVKIRDWSF